MSTPFVQALDALREVCGFAFRVNSGFRCAKHNKEIGGVKRSQHLLGLAADISIEGLSSEQKERFKSLAGKTMRGFIEYPTFYHLDMRAGKKVNIRLS